MMLLQKKFNNIVEKANFINLKLAFLFILKIN